MKHPGMINEISKNNYEIFEWSDKNFLKVEEVIKKYPNNRQQSAVIPVLDIAQRQNRGWLTKSAIEKGAETLRMPFIRVMEIATFYSMFNLDKIGKSSIADAIMC